MNNRTTQIVVGLIFVIAVGSLVYWQKNSTATSANTTTDTVEETTEVMSETKNTDTVADETEDVTETTETNTGSGLTATTVATHNDASSCWAIINGNVYDLTGWIPNHPGGPQAILQLCGTDATAKFGGKHGGNSKVLSILAGFKLGVLEN